ncbi:olfactory receptor 5P6-like [Alligator mississippiensis]|uniref:olfactory receptor 5P6-like n=1 Tax=Alligator mississippiensis TaxID=8496 RepID=UPI002877A9F7|nr:olfactory receptor 5P6-like [Alligator mississippiensis]
MYFFLSHLAFADICISSSVAPKMLVGLFVGRTNISYIGCAAQLTSIVTFGIVECLLLAAMAYDRYVAICNPLLYKVIMSQNLCMWLVAVSYIGGCMNSMAFLTCVLSLSFQGTVELDHFFCDLPALLKLSSTNITITCTRPSVLSGSILSVTLLIITFSYFCILSAILRIRCAHGRNKAFSTCASHLTAVTLFCGTVSFTYLQPDSNISMDQAKIVSVFYVLVIPMLNPLIYSLRNKEVKDAVERRVRKTFC